MKLPAKAAAANNKTPPGHLLRFDWTPLEKDRFLANGSHELAWKKYCGFLDFNLDEYASIQRLLLQEQIKIISRCPLGQEIMGGHEPDDLETFRRLVPLTDYTDYVEWFNQPQNCTLNEKVLFWAESRRQGNSTVRIPFTFNRIRSMGDDAITALILSAASTKGEVSLAPFSKLLINLNLKAVSAALNIAIGQRLDCQNPALTGFEEAKDLSEESMLSFCRGIEKGLQNGLDFIVADLADLQAAGNLLDYANLESYVKKQPVKWHWRMIKAWWVDHILKRSLRASDIWPLRGIVACTGVEPAGLEQITSLWGCSPLLVYAGAEGGFMAIQAWDKKGLTFIPYRNFYEFIPLSELDREPEDGDSQPATLLMNELKTGESYELVITNFHGGPFLRYRTGDYLTVSSLFNAETGVNLPQFSLTSKKS